MLSRLASRRGKCHMFCCLYSQQFIAGLVIFSVRTHDEYLKL